MDKTPLLLIVNPISGTKRKEELLPKIVTTLDQAGYSVTTEYTKGSGDATRLAQSAVDGDFAAVAVCGGDGTVNECARALCGSSIPMGIIPAGSGNGLARHIGLPSDPVAACRAIRPGNERDCDYGMANNEKFFCTFGIGFDAAVTKSFNEQHTRGLNTYLKSAFQEFISYNPKDYTIEINGESHHVKAYLIACCNASQYGNNAYIAPEASITDGLLDVVILKDASHLHTLFAGLDMLTGRLSHNKQVDIIRTTHINIHQLQAGPAHFDGEPTTMPADISVSICPGQIRLFTDPTKKHFTPFVTPINYIRRDIGIAIGKMFKS